MTRLDRTLDQKISNGGNGSTEAFVPLAPNCRNQSDAASGAAQGEQSPGVVSTRSLTFPR